MEIQFVIVRSENTEYLCHNVNGTYMDVSDHQQNLFLERMNFAW